MGGRIDERVDDLELLDDRAGPAVRDDERQRVLVLRADVDEVNVEPVDLGDEVRISPPILAEAEAITVCFLKRAVDCPQGQSVEGSAADVR
jgi:hypothetical protein